MNQVPIKHTATSFFTIPPYKVDRKTPGPNLTFCEDLLSIRLDVGPGNLKSRHAAGLGYFAVVLLRFWWDNHRIKAT